MAAQSDLNTQRRSPLSRERVLSAAMVLADTGGIEALTMRRLGQALDRDPMAIYRHAADKDALLDGVVERVAAELITSREPDSNGHENWEAVLHRTAHTFRRVALAHPHVVPLLLTRLRGHPEVAAITAEVEREVQEGTLTPSLAADRLLAAFQR